MLTKLVQWLIGAGLIVSLWMTLLNNPKMANAYPLTVLFWPVGLVATFGLISLAVIAKRVYDFNDCTEAAEELKRQIVEAKADLTAKGLKMQ